jgi:DNA-binding beta-propeller fold protein YncE
MSAGSSVGPILLAALVAAHAGATPCGAATTIDTVAGTGAPASNGDAGPALATNIGEPFGVAIGPDGALYVTEIHDHRVLRVDLKTGDLAAVAGCGQKGYSGDGGPATAAELNEPYEVRFDPAGNMLFVEMQNHVVRRVDARTGVISTVAGTGQAGFTGDGGPATAAQFRQPHSIAIADDGAIYVADIGNHRIRRIDPKSGIVESIAGSAERRAPIEGQRALGHPLLGPRALFIADGELWIALREGHSVWRMRLADGVLHHVAGDGHAGYAGDGGPAAAARFNGPKGIAIDGAGNVLVADTENHAIRRIDAKTGVISTLAGNGAAGGGGDGGPAAAAQLNRPHGVCVDADGAAYIGDTLNHRVRRVK